VAAQVLEVDDNEENALRQQPGKNGDDAEAPNVGGIYLDLARCALRKKKSEYHTKRAYCAEGRNEDGADVKEDGMHCKQGYGMDGRKRYDAWVGG
jgi:hypothetical protein